MVLRRPREETCCKRPQGAVRRVEQGRLHPREHILPNRRYGAIGPYRSDMDNAHLPPQIDAGPEAVNDACRLYHGTRSGYSGLRRSLIIPICTATGTHAPKRHA